MIEVLHENHIEQDSDDYICYWDLGKKENLRKKSYQTKTQIYKYSQQWALTLNVVYPCTLVMQKYQHFTRKTPQKILFWK